MIRNVCYLLFSLSVLTFFSCKDDYSSFGANEKPVFKKGDVLYYHTDTNRIDTFVVTSLSDNFEWINSYHANLEDIVFEIEPINKVDTGMFCKISFSRLSEHSPDLELIKNEKTTSNFFMVFSRYHLS